MTEKAAEESKAMAEGDLPALDDAFAQSIGYDDAKAFETALSANMQTEKEMQAAQKRRGAYLDELAKESKIFYPPALREYELDDIEARFASPSPAQAQRWNAISQIRKRRMRNCERVGEYRCRYAR